MSKELVIAATRHETKVAILEDDQLVELYFQRSNEYSLAGSIHKGRVTRVLPGMQSAFVDLGLERDTFLYVSDFFEEHDDIDTVTDEKSNRRDRGPQRTPERLPLVVSEPVEPMAVSSAPDTPALALAEPQSALPVAPPAFSAENAGPRGDGDRGVRNDRRGRRSRRRRPRGHGFPDNKYAQPSGPEERESAPLQLSPSFEEEGDAASDVIILPGESLAKYRHVIAPELHESSSEAHSRLESAPEEEAPEEEESPEFFSDLRSEEEDAEIESRAEELEAADKILSHHDASVDAFEEKIEEVRNDQPASPFIVNDIEVDDEPSAASAEWHQSAPAEPLRVEPVPIDMFERREALHHERDSEPLESGQAMEVEGLSAAELAEDEISSGPEAGEMIDFDGADLDDVPASEEDAAALSAASESTPEVQSATMREQGGRYPHRVSRRMRRRRGGNRFGSQQSPTQLEAGGAAPAPATQIEARSEPRIAEPRIAEPRIAEPRPADKSDRVLPSISDLLKAGQEIIVQIAKEPLGQKGARITSHIALPGRYVVFMPSVSHLGVSRKVESDEERQRLKRILQTHRVGTTGGFIVRTAGEGVPEEEIAADMDFLYKLWLDIREKAEKRPAPLLLHCDLDVTQRILRDQVTEDFKAIWVDSEEMYENVLGFVQRFQPALVGRVKMYTREAPIFDAFGITPELEKALRPKVWLKSGGYIVINQTEALVAIDINTGKYVGKSNRLEDTIVKTNLEAVKEIVRQIRLRDLGGIIVVDFIDMDERKNRQKVMQALEEAMQVDKAPNKILQFNDFGLVAITRKRVKQSLERALCSPCPYCEAAGYVKSVQTVIGEILVEAQKIRKAIDSKDVILRVHPDIAKVLKASDNKYLEELEESLARPVLVKGDPALHHEKFDLG